VTLRILSLGAGVQSSRLALGVLHGELPPIDFAVFADTQNESREVYDWLRWLEQKLPFPIYRVTRGNLAEDSLIVRTSKTGSKYLKPMIPAYIDRDGQKGIAMRHCTADYKITMIMREIRNRRKKGQEVTQYLGISFDEVHRMKPAPYPWIRNRYPLVEWRQTRGHCLEWMEFHGYPRPPRSACIYCPYHSDEEWKRLKLHQPAEFAEAAEYERRLQHSYSQLPTMDGVPYLHPSRRPLETVEFTDDRQSEMFGNECAGVCGV
jgi:hypothetical protein